MEASQDAIKLGNQSVRKCGRMFAQGEGDSCSKNAEAPIARLVNVSKIFNEYGQSPSSLKESFLGFLLNPRKHQVVHALTGVSLEISRGQSVGIIGANGSGKSTLLRILAGIVSPSSGKAEVSGRVLGMIDLGAGFHYELSGEDNVLLQAAIYRISSCKARLIMERVFEFAQLQEFRLMPLKHYSSGMLARLGFAIAINCDPEILLIDEVLSVGDQSFQELCLREIRRMKAEGTTIVFVSHQLELVEQICDRIVWIKDGQIYRDSGPVDVLEAYHHEYIEQEFSNSEGTLTLEWILTGQPGRFGTGEARILSVRTLDLFGRIRRNFCPGESISIDILYEADFSIRVLDCSIALEFEDGSSVAHWRAEPARAMQRPRDGRGRFKFTMPQPPLGVGHYTLTVAISKPGGLGEHYDQYLRLHHFAIVGNERRWAPIALNLVPKVHWRSQSKSVPLGVT